MATDYFKTPTGIGVLVCGLLILLGPLYTAPDMHAKRLSLFAAIAATGLSLVMVILPDYQGLLRRLMFVITFTWLVVYLPAPRGR